MSCPPLPPSSAGSERFEWAEGRPCWNIAVVWLEPTNDEERQRLRQWYPVIASDAVRLWLEEAMALAQVRTVTELMSRCVPRYGDDLAESIQTAVSTADLWMQWHPC